MRGWEGFAVTPESPRDRTVTVTFDIELELELRLEQSDNTQEQLVLTLTELPSLLGIVLAIRSFERARNNLHTR